MTNNRIDVDGFYHLLLLAFGDNVISLSLLDRVPGRRRVLGTGLTRSVVDLLGFQGIELEEPIFEDIPAFYDLRKAGPLRALGDFRRLLAELKRRRAVAVGLEKFDFRSRLLERLSGVRVVAPSRTSNVYLDRRARLETIYDVTIDLPPPAVASGVRKVLINPASRLVHKNIATEDLRIVIRLLRERGLEVSLIDYDARLGDERSTVDHYHTGTTLNAAADLLRETDYYIGADSFFVHLAFALKKPFYVFLNVRNDYFMPPGCLARNNYIVRNERPGDLAALLAADFARLGLF